MNLQHQNYQKKYGAQWLRLVVECLTKDQGVVGSSLNMGTALCLWARHYPLLIVSTGSTQEDPSQHDWKNVDWDVKNQIKQKKKSEV